MYSFSMCDTCLLSRCVQERPEPAVPCQLLVPAAEPGEEREQGPRHAERHLPQQRHHEVHADQRGLHPAAKEGEATTAAELAVNFFFIVTRTTADQLKSFSNVVQETRYLWVERGKCGFLLVWAEKDCKEFGPTICETKHGTRAVEQWTRGVPIPLFTGPVHLKNFTP